MVTRRVSVEISSSAVRMAEVVVGRGQPELVRLGQVALPPRAVIDGVILDRRRGARGGGALHQGGRLLGGRGALGDCRASCDHARDRDAARA